MNGTAIEKKGELIIEKNSSRAKWKECVKSENHEVYMKKGEEKTCYIVVEGLLDHEERGSLETETESLEL